MIHGIGSSSYFSPVYGNGQSNTTTGLDAQLERCSRQLADWVGCESAKTPEGKEIIQTLTNQLREIKGKIAEVEKVKQRESPASPLPSKGAGQGSVGGLLDTFA